MTRSRLAYATFGGGTALVALMIDQVLWVVTNLAFGPGVLIGIFSPLLVGGTGVVTGLKAMNQHGDRFGGAIIAANLIATVVGMWWALIIGRSSSGIFASPPAPAFILLP